MKNAIVKLGFCLLFLCAGYAALAAPPTVAVTRVGSTPTNAAFVDFNVVFSQPVTGFGDVSDFSISGTGSGGASAALQSGTGASYVVRVSGYTDGTVTLAITPGAAQNGTAEGNAASAGGDPTVTYDGTGPTVTINKKGSQNDPTSSSPIRFTVTFNEAINAGTLEEADIDLSASTTGGLSITDISEVTPNLVYEIEVTLSGAAIAGNVIATVPASGVADPLGNTNSVSSSTDNTVAYITRPVMGAPTITAPTTDGATLGGTYTSDGGTAITGRGIYYDNSPSVSTGDTQNSNGSGLNPWSEAIGGLNSATHYYFKAYATNSVNTTLSSELDFWTLAGQPNNSDPAPQPTSAATSSTAIHLTFDDADDFPNTEGYVILRRAGSAPVVTDLPDGTHPDDLGPIGTVLPGGSTLVAIITDQTLNDYDDTGLDPCQDYYYAVALFNWDNDHATTNYRYGGPGGTTFLSTHAVTWCNTSSIILNGPASTLNFATEIDNDVSNNSDGLEVFPLRLVDGAGGDDRKTELASITISIDHPELLQDIAYVDGAYVQRQTPAASVVFNIPPGQTIANVGGNNDFAFRATFIASPVIDQTPIIFAVTAATTRVGTNGAGSGFASANAGGAATNSTQNKMDVVATKMVFSDITDPINPNSDFSLKITAKDAADNVDTNVGGTVTLSKTAGTGSFSSTDTPGGVTRTLVGGETTWSLLRFTTATTPATLKTLTADHSGSIGNATHDFTVESLGVVITGPTQNFCYNTSATTPSTYSTLGQIKIAESDGSDFAEDDDQTFSLLLPAGFIFDVTATPTVGATGPEIGAPTFVNYTSNNVVRVKYNVSGVGAPGLDELTINNLKVKYVGTTPPVPSPGLILRIGGNASQAGNADTDAKPHGNLTASNGLVIDFQNTNGAPITATQTSFSKVSDPPILLQGLRDPGPTVLAGAGVVFSGDGIALDGSQYKFYPANVNNGNHDITLTYTEPVTGCVSTITKTFNVFSSIISGLKTSYCINEAATPLTTPTGLPATNLILCGLAVVPIYNPSQYVYRYVERSINQWVDLPAQNSFDPAHPLFASEIGTEGGVHVSVWYINQCSGAPEYWVGTFVRVNQKPTISFSPTFAQGVCATDDPYNMTGFPYDNTNNYDEFWSSAVGQPSTPANGITGDRATGFKFDPELANGTATDKQVQLNYTHEDEFTHCTNETSLVIDVWAKPSPVPATNIFIRGDDDVTGEFCHEEALTPFSTTAVPGEFHRWSIDDLSRPPVEADEYALSPNDFGNTAGVPNVGETSNYELTRIVHRQFGPHPFFPIIVQIFAGCESDPTALSVEIMEPTTVEAGDDAIICEGNPLDLSLLNAEINSPDVALGGQWTSTTAGGPDGFFYKDTEGNLQSGFGVATHYRPSQAEIDARLAILRLTTNDPSGPCGPVTDVVFVTINPGVTVSFPVSPVNVCSTTSIAVEGKVSNAALGFTWSIVSGAGAFAAGTEENLITTYEPSIGLQDFGGSVTLRLETEDPDGPGPCDVVGTDVIVNISQKPKIDAGPDYDICADQVITLNGNIDNPISSASTGTWTHDGLGTIVNPAALVTQYDPDALEDPGPVADPNSKKITFTITSDVPGLGNVCPAETDVVVVTIHARPEPPQPGSATPPTYCVGQNVDLLRATGTSLTWYDNTLSQISTGPSLSTGVVADAEKKVTFHVSQTFDKLGPFAGCESAKTPITITVNPLPVPAFDFANQCLGDYMKFKDQSTIAQPAVGTRSIVSWQWNFDDGLGFTDAGAGPIPPGTQDDRTLGAYDSLRHIFRNTGLYNIRLAVVTSDGCTATLTHAPIKVGEIPQARFSSRMICDQDDTQFVFDGAAPAPGSTFSYAWNFGDPSSGPENASALRDPPHKFTGVGTYDVELTVTTDLNCANTIVTKTSILPYITTFPYIENFENATHGWVSQGFPETSWNLSTGTNHIQPNAASAAGSTFWVTNKDVDGKMTYTNGERSVLYGPCVNMTALDRPVLAMDYFSDTEAKGDGAYIEVLDETEDESTRVWKRLGESTSGLNWYNENSIGGLAKIGPVGQELSQFGWSGTSEGWKTGRFNLDEHTNKTRLRFRIVFGSNSSQPIGLDEPFDGFAMDYFKLETRNRLVLVENFTTRSGSSVVTNNRDAFKAFPSVAASSEVVKIEYHTGLPAAAGDPADPIFQQNPMDPNARASFYGLSAVPRGYIDGYTNAVGAGMFSSSPGNWASNYYSTESLVTSPLDIVINTPSITDGVITVSGTVTAKEFALKPNFYSLYIAVVEESVDADSYVLRKLLPSASGQKVPATAVNGSFTFSESWSIDRSYLSSDPKLIAVAFVQSDIRDALTGKREVLQAAYNDDVPTFEFTTGTEVPFLEQTALYPNPADRLVTIELPKATATGVEVKVIDQVGREVIQSAIGAGERKVTIDTGGLSGAVYIVQLKENGVFTNRKLLITHRH